MLESYSAILSTIASAATVPLLLSPSLICKDFMQKGSSDHIRPFIFVQGLIRSLVFLQFGVLSNLKALVRIHALGLILYSVYFILYYKYCSNKKPGLTSLSKGAAFVFSLLGYVNLKTDSLAAAYFEVIATVIHLGLLAIPLLNLKHILRTKSTAGMPFPIILCAHIVSFTWLLLGISVNNTALMFQMLIGTILTGIQLSLIFIYPSKQTKSKTEKKED